MASPTAASQCALQSWGRYPHAPPARVVPLQWRHAPPDLGAAAPALAYGQGRSYGDVCLNGGGTLLTTAGLDRLLAFDREAGVVRCEAGLTFADLLAVIVPHGWFLPVTPGTRFVSVGGAIANDVHGKNHHVAGTFGRFVTAMEVVRSSGERVLLTPDGPHADLFAATVGGLGLTGLVTWAEFRLQKVASDRIDQTTTRFASLDDFFARSAHASAESPYVVAWLDALRPEGRGLLIQGDHAPAEAGLPANGTPPARLALPFDAPARALSPLTVRALNALYYRQPVGRSRVPYGPFFYPLDAVRDWNRAYGRRGFVQYQCVVPFADSDAAVREILARFARSRAASFLAVLKTFGDLPSPGLLSFPRPGVTLALDLPFRGEPTLRLLRACDRVVAEANGAVYPAKDACMTPESFRTFFPAWERFVPFVDPAFSSSFWRRVTAP